LQLEKYKEEVKRSKLVQKSILKRFFSHEGDSERLPLRQGKDQPQIRTIQEPN